MTGRFLSQFHMDRRRSFRPSQTTETIRRTYRQSVRVHSYRQEHLSPISVNCKLTDRIYLHTAEPTAGFKACTNH